MNTKMIQTTINGKFEIIMPEHRAQRPEWYREQGWEKQRLESMYESIVEGDVVYYVGSELGEMPALCQMWGAQVVNVEPNHTAWPVIKAVWKANGLALPLYNFAGFASDKTQLQPPSPDLELMPDTYQGHGWEIQKDGWPLFSKGPIVKAHGFSELYLEADSLPQVKIDDLVTMAGQTPDAISIDVEGSEWRVLRGAENTLRECKPKIWLSGHPEFMFHQWSEYLTDLRNWIKGFGYRETILDYQHELHTFYEPIDE